MTTEKGLDPAVADKIGEYVKHKGMYKKIIIVISRTQEFRSLISLFLIGGLDLLAQLEKDASLTSNKSAKQGLTDMGILFTLLKAYNVLDKVNK